MFLISHTSPYTDQPDCYDHAALDNNHVDPAVNNNHRAGHNNNDRARNDNNDANSRCRTQSSATAQDRSRHHPAP